MPEREEGKKQEALEIYNRCTKTSVHVTPKKNNGEKPQPEPIGLTERSCRQSFLPLSLDHSTSATNVSSRQARQNQKGNPLPACWSNTWTLRLRNDDNMTEECGVSRGRGRAR